MPPVPSFTPENRSYAEPQTPARNPANIDRRGLHGLGELATPRWTRTEEAKQEAEHIPAVQEQDELEEEDPQDDDEEPPDHPDSPWTIEAVDGEPSDKEEVCDNSSCQFLRVVDKEYSRWKCQSNVTVCAQSVRLRTRVEAKKYCIPGPAILWIPWLT